MSNLQKIRTLISNAKTKLESLTINPDALDKIGSVATERLNLREQILTLEAAEESERDRLAAEERKNNGKRRRAALVELAATSEKLVAEHESLTEQTHILIKELIGIIVTREQVFSKATTGLDKSIYRELFSTEEHNNLIYEMRRSALGIYSGEFSLSFQNAVNEQVGDDYLKRELCELVKPYDQYQKPIQGALPLLTNAAKALQFKPVPAAPVDAEEVIEHEKQGNHYESDLRVPDHRKAAVAEKFAGREIV